MKKVVINDGYGGPWLSQKAFDLYLERSGMQTWPKPSSKYDYLYTSIVLLVPTEEYEIAYVKDKEIDNYRISSAMCFYPDKISREDPIALEIIKELKHEAFGPHAHLKIIEIPDDVEYSIEENEGSEWIVENHRVWY